MFLYYQIERSKNLLDKEYLKSNRELGIDGRLVATIQKSNSCSDLPVLCIIDNNYPFPDLMDNIDPLQYEKFKCQNKVGLNIMHLGITNVDSCSLI